MARRRRMLREIVLLRNHLALRKRRTSLAPVAGSVRIAATPSWNMFLPSTKWAARPPIAAAASNRVPGRPRIGLRDPARTQWRFSGTGKPFVANLLSSKPEQEERQVASTLLLLHRYTRSQKVECCRGRAAWQKIDFRLTIENYTATCSVWIGLQSVFRMLRASARRGP